MAARLLIDRWEKPNPSVTAFSEPENGDYAGATRVPFGRGIRLPEPCGVVPETSDFPPRR